MQLLLKIGVFFSFDTNSSLKSLKDLSGKTIVLVLMFFGQ